MKSKTDLPVGAAGFTLLGAFLLSHGYSQGREDGRASADTGWATIGISGALYLAGGVLWGVYFRRLEALERATEPSRAARLRLNHAGPIPLLRGAGVGLSLAF